MGIAKSASRRWRGWSLPTKLGLSLGAAGVLVSFCAWIWPDLWNSHHEQERPTLNAPADQTPTPRKASRVLAKSIREPERRSGAPARRPDDKLPVATIARQSPEITGTPPPGSNGTNGEVIGDPGTSTAHAENAIDAQPSAPSRHTGTVKWFNASKGYGFIADSSGAEVFVHFSEIREPGYRTLDDGAAVEFDLRPGPKGFQAQNVKVLHRATEQVIAHGAQQPAIEALKHSGALDPIPKDITIVLPKKLKVSKYESSVLSRLAGGYATQIRVCIVDRGGDGDAAKFCSSFYSSHVSRLRNDLRNSGITLNPLQDAVRRMERGATVEELRYIADVLDYLAQEFSKRSQ